MSTVRDKRSLPSEVVSNPAILGGEPCINGTRVPAVTILAYLNAGYGPTDIFRDYPSLPPDAIEAVKAWAAKRPPDA